ncbi:hypothetical protein EBZ37_11425 [bacterium]|nr:hypothetical protein [bacterium]
MISRLLRALALMVSIAPMAVLAASEDDQIIQDLEFFRSFPLVQNLDSIEESQKSFEKPLPPLSKKTEVKNEPH